MSRTMDDYVLSMTFDNRQFERNVQTSIDTVGELKRSLDMTGAAKGLENVGTAAKKLDLSPIGDAVGKVGLRFSALYAMADMEFRRIYNSARTYATRIVSAFTIDPVKTGLSEYETQIGAVQTILANTESKGTNLNDVNRALDELNTYADKTIYNFTEMTRNIGTFTAAGVDLDTSVGAIKGIANLAAVSGSTSQQASTAMYQLSQALASGTIRLMDWNSVVNAGMGGEVFQNALKETARVHGVAIDEIIEKNGSFRESLSDGWLTSEILTDTLAKFTGDLSEAQLRQQGYTEDQIKEIIKLGQTANDAATKVKTFTQLMDTLKEALQSGWAQTWKLIIGDFEDAKSLWTGVSDTLGGFINDFSESRNNLLSGSLTSNWDQLISKIGDAGVESSDFAEALKAAAISQDVDIYKIIEDYGSLENAFRAGAISSETVTKALNQFSDTTKFTAVDAKKLGEVVDQVMNGGFANGYEAIQKLSEEGYEVSKVQSLVNKVLTKGVNTIDDLSDAKLKDNGYTEEEINLIRQLTTSAQEAGMSLGDFMKTLGAPSGRELLIESAKNIFHGLLDVLRPIKKAFSEIFPPMTADRLYNLIEGFRDLTSRFKLSEDSSGKLQSIFRGLFAVVDIGVTLFKEIVIGAGKLLGVFSDVGGSIFDGAASLGDWLVGVRDSIKENNVFGETIDKIVGAVAFVKDGLTKAATAIKDFFAKIGSKFNISGFSLLSGLVERVKARAEDASTAFTAIRDGAVDAFTGVYNAIEKSGILKVFDILWQGAKKIGSFVTKAFGALGKAISDEFGNPSFEGFLDLINSGALTAIAVGIAKFVGSFSGASGEFKNFFKDLGTGFIGIIDEAKGCFTALQQSIKADVLKKIAVAIAILTASLVVLSLIDSAKLAASLTVISGLFIDLMMVMKLFGGNDLKFDGATKAIGMMLAISTAVLIMSFALANIARLGFKEMMTGLAGIVGMTGVVLMAANNLGKNASTGNLVKTMGQIILFSVGIKILAAAVEDLGGMNLESLGKGLLGVGTLMAGVVAFIKLSNGAKLDPWTAVGIIAVGGAIRVLASSVKAMGDMSWGSLARGLLGVGLALAAVASAAHIMPQNITEVGFGVLIMSSALVVIAHAISMLGKQSWESLAKGLLAIVGTVGMLAIALNAMKGTLAGAGAMIIAAGALAILTPVLMSLGNMSWESIAKGLVAIAGAFVVLGVAGAVLGGLVPAIIGLSSAFTLIGTGVLLFGGGMILAGVGLTALATGLGALIAVLAGGTSVIVTAIASIAETLAGLIPLMATKFAEGLVAFCGVIQNGAPTIAAAIKAVVLELVDVFVECVPAFANGFLQLIVGLLDALVQYTPQIVDGLFDFILALIGGITARIPELVQAGVEFVMAFFQGVVDALKGIDVNVLLQGIAGVGLITALVGALGLVAGLVPAAMLGVLGVGLVIAELALVLAAVGKLSEIPGLEELIGQGSGLLASIGSALGSFVGGIVGGIASGMTSVLPQIGQDLSDFMKNASPFFEGLALVNTAAIDSVGSLAKMILILTAADILDGLTSWFTGGSSLVTFGKDLAEFGPEFVKYCDAVKNITPDTVQASANAALILAEMASKLPNQGGVVGWFAGENSLSVFGKELAEFGPYLAEYANSVKNVNPSVVTASASAAKVLSEMANNLPNQGGVVSWFTGDNTLSKFGKNLVKFGEYLADYADELVGVNVSAISASAAALQSLVTTAKTASDTDFDGLGSFGKALKSLAESGIDDFIDVFDDNHDAIDGVGKNMISTFIMGAKGMLMSCTTAFTSIVASCVMTLRNGKDSFASAAQYLVQGFANGISANTYMAAAKAKAMAAAAAAAAKAELDEHSPSKVGYSIGNFFGIAFVNALDDMGDKAYKAGANIATLAKGGLTLAADGVTDALSGDLNPVITPIVDLSNVKTGLAAIDGMFNASPSVGTMSNLSAINSSMNNQNGTSDDIVSAIEDLGRRIADVTGDTYNFNGITYSEGSDVATALQTLVRAAKMERRI